LLNAPAFRDAGASQAAFPRWSVGTMSSNGLFIASCLMQAKALRSTIITLKLNGSGALKRVNSFF